MENEKVTPRQGDKENRLHWVVLALCLLLAGCNSDEPGSDAGPVSGTSEGNQGPQATTAHSNSTEDAEATTDETTDSEVNDNSADPPPPGSPETVRARELFDSLLSPQSQQEWDQAQADLKGLGAAARPVVLEELASSDQARRIMAAQELVLLDLDFSDETDDLLAALDDESEQVRTYCAFVLLTQSPDAAEQAVATLIDVLRGTDAAMSEMAASYLQIFPESVLGQLPLVIAALRDAPPKVAVPLIEAIAAAGPQAADANEVLTDLAESDDAEVAAAARQALDAISGTSE
jgi:hypothetical protein